MDNLNWPGNVSWSAFNNFRECERRHYYEKVLKIPPSNEVETKYGKFGNCVHSTIENIDKYSDVISALDDYWFKFRLYETDMSMDSALKQVKYALGLGYKFKHKEEKIEFSIGNLKFKLIIDGTLIDGSVLDWKTSTFNVKKVNDYKEQLKWYVWGTWKSKGYIPPKAILVFTKAEKIFEWSFSEEELKEFENQIFSVIKSANEKLVFEDHTPNFDACFFCAFKNRCTSDQLRNVNELFVQLEYDHDFVTIKTSMPQEFNQIVSDELSYEMDNAYFVKKAMVAKGIKNFDPTIRMYKNQKCAIGFLQKIKKYIHFYAESKGKRAVIKEVDKRILDRNMIKTKGCLEGVELRPYQKDAVNHIIQDKISMTEICTGAGKTVIAAEIIRKLSYKTLFVVDRNVLLQQTVDEFESLGLENIGTVTEGKQNWNDITIASIQTISRLIDKKDKEALNQIVSCNVVVIDEAHGSKSKSYQKLMKNVGAEYRIGLTGTAYSDGNNSLELYKSFGFPDYKIRAIDLINQGYLVMPDIKFLQYDEGFIINGTYDEIYNQVLQSKERLRYLEGLSTIHKQHNILIMVDKLEHKEIIRDLNFGEMYVFTITGATNKKQRNEIIKHMKNSKGNILIATSQIIQKGVNIPTLDVIINYSANLGSVKTIQSLGRVLRKSPGKDKAWYYDFEDTHRSLKSHTMARKKALEEQGYEF